MSYIQRENNFFIKTYNRLPLEVSHAEGMYITTNDGKCYLDFLGGIAVNTLGHSHPKIIAAVEKQIRRYAHVSNFFYQDAQIEFGEMLCKLSGYDKVFLANSGSETTEGALKLARFWGNLHGKMEVLSLSGGFHGRTYGALSLMDKPKYKDGMEPFLPNTKVINFDDKEALIQNVNEKTAAVVLEFMQGEGGVRWISNEYVELLFQLKEKYNFLVLADEVQAGAGRTGSFNSFTSFACKPDIIWLAKGIGGGLPLGAILTTNNIAELWSPGKHGTTFGGNAISCAAGKVVLQELENGLMRHAKQNGDYLMTKLNSLKEAYPDKIKEIRGSGAMIGIEVNGSAEHYVKKLLDKFVIANSTNENVIRLVPPLIFQEQDSEIFANSLEQCLKE